MKLIKGSKSDGVANSNPYYNPKEYRGSKGAKSVSGTKKMMFGVVFIALILVLTSLIDRFMI